LNLAVKQSGNGLAAASCMWLKVTRITRDEAGDITQIAVGGLSMAALRE